MSKKLLVRIRLILFAFLFYAGGLSAQQVENLLAGFVYPKGRLLLESNGEGGGTPYYFSGTNNYYLMYKPKEMVEDVLNDMVLLGQKAVRMWFFMDGSATHDGYVIQPEAGVYDENTLKHIDEIMAAIARRNLKVVPVFVNYWSHFGGMSQYAQWVGTNQDQFYSNEQCKQLFKDYMSMWANRVNTVTGVAYKDDPTILSWQLTNEARATRSTLDDFVLWVREMSDYLRTQDSNHMISLGDEGLFNYSNEEVEAKNSELSGYQITKDWPYAGGMGDWEAVIQMPNISYGTIHNYATDNWSYTVEWGESWTKYHIEVANKYNKPCVMEEYDKAYSGQWTRAADQERAEVLERYQEIIREWNMAGDMSWMLVGRNYTDPVEDGYTMDPEAPVEKIWLYRVKWAGDGHQYSRYDPYTGAAISSHCALMNKKNGGDGTVAPIADAGSLDVVVDRDRDGKEIVTLDGSNSFDPDGAIVAYSWNHSGNEIATGEKVSVELPIGTHTITLAVTDNDNKTSTDEVQLILLEGGVRTFEAETAALSGNTNLVSGADASNGQYVQIESAEASVQFTIDNVPAGLTYPVSFVYRSYNADAENGPKNNYVSSSANSAPIDYVWPASAIWTTEVISLPLKKGSNTITIEAYWGYMEFDNISIEGIGNDGNIAPVANAGIDLIVSDEDDNGIEAVILDGSESKDADGEIVSYSWKEKGVELGTGVRLPVELSLGAHEITLTVTDNEGAVGSDVLIVEVRSDSYNAAPVANAGADQFASDLNDDGCENVLLSAEASTDDKEIVSYEWSVNGEVISSEESYTYCFPVGTTPVTLVVQDQEGLSGSDQVLITVSAYSDVNLALDKPATVSSTDGYGGAAADAVDGDVNTRWASAWSDPEWLQVDLESVYTISRVVIVWEQAYSTDYEIQTSYDAQSWNSVYATSSGKGNTEEISLSGTGRYIRLYCEARASEWGHSVWEFEVYGRQSSENNPPIANAGSDKTIFDSDNDGVESYTFDGSLSTDSDGTIISYIWTEGGVQEATGIQPIISLSAGMHTITLTVIDDAGATDSDDVIIEVGVGTDNCSGIAEWDPEVVYSSSNTQVLYNGVIYTNKWYTKGQNPEENSGTWEVWTVVGTCNENVSMVSRLATSRYTIFPNPTGDVLKIKSDSTFTSYRIFDFNGTEIMCGEGNQINLTNIKSGLYFIQINNSEPIRFLKQ